MNDRSPYSKFNCPVAPRHGLLMFTDRSQLYWCEGCREYFMIIRFVKKDEDVRMDIGGV